MNEKEVFDAICDTISERTDCPVESIGKESTFRDLGIDSLDTVELVMNLEDKLGISIELDGKISTVGDLVSFILAK